MKKTIIPVVFFFLLFFVFEGRQTVYADCRPFSGMIENGSFAVADNRGQIISSCNEDVPFIPASIIKIPLALAAFEILGPDFQFVTSFYIDEKENLFIKGEGDPFLVSEEADVILEQLIARGVKRINGIFIDDSSYNLVGKIPGRSESDNPYDAPINALVVNFNTVFILVKEDGSILSAEPQTPTLPIMKEIGRGLLPGKYRLNVCQHECHPDEQSARYAAELFRALQRKKGLSGNGPQEKGLVPDKAKLIYTHKNTKRLTDVVLSLLKYSNNVIANQVFLHCGVKEFGGPATWEKAEKAVRESLGRQLEKLTVSQILLEEGAGLSRNNSVTARSMIKVLEKFQPYAYLLQEKKNASVKSGTLQGVYNYAGYLHGGRPFTILLNQEKNTRDIILKRLDREQHE